jgi:hypothetical protein
VLQKFGLRVKGRFNPFRDSAGCTIVMRWQPRLKSNFSEDQTRFLETLPRSRSHSLRAIFRRATNQPAIQIRRAHVKWKEIFFMPAQRFGEQHAGSWPFSSISLEESTRNAESCVSRSWSELFLLSRRRCLSSSCGSLSAMELCCAQFIPRFRQGWNTS